MEPKHVLVLEDEEEVRASLEAHLVAGGYRVSGVASAAAAIARLREDPPDIVVTDLGMPGLDGFGFVTMLRHMSNFNAPIVAVSGRTSERDIEQAMKSGVDAFLAKPVSRQQLLDKLAELLSKKE